MCLSVDYVLGLSYMIDCDLIAMSISYYDKLKMTGLI